MTGTVTGQRGPGAGSFHGRAGRGEFWIHFSANVFALAVVVGVPVYGPFLVLPWAFGILAVMTRRLHDMQRSGWWQIVPMLVGLPFFATIGFLISRGLIEGPRPTPVFWSNIVNWLGIAWVAGCAVLMIWIGFFPGTKGSNRFGEADELLV